jgi:hypothetical protein
VKRVFYIECSGAIWRSVATHCQTEAGWVPVLWTAGAADRPAVGQAFPQALFVAGPDATLGLQHDQAPWPLEPVSLETITALAVDESIGLHMMDRMDPGCGSGFPHDARRCHWRGLLLWWSAAIDHLKPDLIVFSISPHVVFDYALLALARHRGIATCMFERLGLPGWVFPMADYAQGSEALRRALKDKPRVPVGAVPGAFGAWLSDSLGGGAAVPANFRKKLERYRLGQRLPSLPRAVGHELKRAWVLWRRHGGQPVTNSYLRSAHLPHGRAGQWETLLARLKGVWFKRGLMKQYDALALARSPEAGEDYVFLALHYQPERATVPMGGLFGDQLVIVDWLLAALPPGWKLYVKEHPWQLQPFGRGEVQRSSAFYQHLCRHESVVLVPRDLPTSGVVRGARAVATVTGSVGWDALCAGIPVLLFGAAWYRDCPGARTVSTLDGLRAEFDRLRLERPLSVEAVAAFCLALSRTCVAGVLEPELEHAEHVPDANAAFAMANSLIEFEEGSTANPRASDD